MIPIEFWKDVLAELVKPLIMTYERRVVSNGCDNTLLIQYYRPDEVYVEILIWITGKEIVVEFDICEYPSMDDISRDTHRIKLADPDAFDKFRLLVGNVVGDRWCLQSVGEGTPKFRDLVIHPRSITG